MIKDILLQIETEIDSNDKYISEYGDTPMQRAFNAGMKNIYDIIKSMYEERCEENRNERRCGTMKRFVVRFPPPYYDEPSYEEHINNFAETNDLTIIQIAPSHGNGIFVLFEKGGVNDV